jgi:hypothetical protein
VFRTNRGHAITLNLNGSDRKEGVEGKKAEEEREEII